MGINKEIGGKRVMSDLDKEELIATRKLHGLDDGLFEEEDKIEVGEYVRTNNKGIKRIDRIDNNKTVNKYLYFTGIEDFEGKEYGIIKTTEIVKHSKQLIDLIEVGDIVNGMEVLDIKKIVKDIEPFKTIYSKEKISICVLQISEAGAYYIDVRDTDIKTILTKESYMTNCYKVGGEDE